MYGFFIEYTYEDNHVVKVEKRYIKVLGSCSKRGSLTGRPFAIFHRFIPFIVLITEISRGYVPDFSYYDNYVEQ